MSPHWCSSMYWIARITLQKWRSTLWQWFDPVGHHLSKLTLLMWAGQHVFEILKDTELRSYITDNILILLFQGLEHSGDECVILKVYADFLLSYSVVIQDSAMRLNDMLFTESLIILLDGEHNRQKKSKHTAVTSCSMKVGLKFHPDWSISYVVNEQIHSVNVWVKSTKNDSQ